MDSQNLPVVKRRCLLCECGNGICEFLPLKNNPSKRFYKCLAPHCSKKSFFKYEEDVTREDIFIDVPYCGGCDAGLCRVRKFKDGENAGRILFSCTIKEGQGSCGYEVFQDVLVRMEQVNPSQTVSPSPLTTCNGINSQDVDTVMENRPTEREVHSDLPLLTSGNLWTCSGSNMNKQSLLHQKENLDDYSSLPRKRLQIGDLEHEGASPPFGSIQGEHLVAPVISTPIQNSPLRPVNLLLESKTSPSQSKNHLGAGASILSPCDKISKGGVSRVMRQLQWDADGSAGSTLPNKRLCNGDNKGNCSPSDSRATAQTGSMANSSPCVESSRVTPNMNVDVSSKETSCTTPPHVPSRKEPSGMFSPTSQLVSTAIEDFVEDLQNKLVSLLEKTNPKDHEAMAREAGSTFSVLDLISIDYRDLKHQVTTFIECARSLDSKETELLSSEADLKDKKNQLEDLKRKCATASQELKDISEVHDVIEVECDAAKAAFEKARSLLRR